MNLKLWKSMREILDLLGSHYGPRLERFARESGLGIPVWGLLMAALTFEPQPISPERLQVRGPYTSRQGYLDRLEAAAAQGYLTKVSPGEYRLTETGRAETERLIRELREVMAEADPSAPADAERIIALLRRLLGVSLSTPPPPDAWSVRHALKLMPSLKPPLPYIDQALSCLAGYRDDAHLAAWQPSGLSAIALETLTFLWRGEADSLDGLCERLAHRGHSRQAFAGALAELRERDFVQGPDTAPRLTQAGRRFRQDVEVDTNHYFFAPWGCLNDREKSELFDLLTRLRDGLKASAPA